MKEQYLCSYSCEVCKVLYSGDMNVENEIKECPYCHHLNYPLTCDCMKPDDYWDKGAD